MATKDFCREAFIIIIEMVCMRESKNSSILELLRSFLQRLAFSMGDEILPVCLIKNKEDLSGSPLLHEYSVIHLLPMVTRVIAI